MADYFTGRITFLETALQIMEVKELLDEYEENHNSLNIEVHTGLVIMESDEARWGHFEDLEDLLRLNYLPYETESDSHYGDASGIRVYRSEFGNNEMYFDTSSYCGSPIISVLTVREYEEDNFVGLKKYLDQYFPRYSSMGELVTEYKGDIEPDYLIKISPVLNMLVKLIGGRVHYQMDHDGQRGKVYVTKIVSITGQDDIALHTFFTRDDKQYWLHELTRVRGKYISAEEWV